MVCLPPAIFTNAFTISDSVMRSGVIPKILNVAKTKGVPILDARTPTLSKQGYFQDGVHPDSTGHKMLADIFYEGILNNFTVQLYKIWFLWFGPAPGIIGAGTDTLAKPFLHAYPVPDSMNTHAAVIICPGGGYTHLSMQKEGDSVAQWFVKNGVSAFVLRYRYNPYLHPIPLNDAKRAIRLVRYYASLYGIDTTKIGVMGFSAGGHMASTLGTHYDTGNGASLDPIEQKKSRPDFMALIYPVITMTGPYTHTGSRDALLGTTPAPSAALLDSLSNQKWVTPQTCQTFLAHGGADVTVPIQNSRMFDSACAANNVPHKLVVDPGKGHGFGMAGIWPDSLLAWLKTRGIISAGVNVRFKPDKRYQHSPIAVQTSSEKGLRISFQNGVLHRVTIYSITGKRVADFGTSAARQCVWRPSGPGVYVARILLDGSEPVETINYVGF
jgi:acetyl esterase/lipase